MNPVLTEEAAQTLGELMSKFRGIAHFSSSSGKWDKKTSIWRDFSA